MVTKVLALTAPRRHGKDTFARLLKQLYPQAKDYALADELKRVLARLIMQEFGIDVFTADGKEKELIRPLLIALGCAWREIDPLHWVRVVHEKIEIEQPKIAIIKDCRFSNEAQFFLDQYLKDFHLLEITRLGGAHPTDEELKNIPLIQKQINSRVTWGHTEYTDEAMLPIVKEWCSKYFL